MTFSWPISQPVKQLERPVREKRVARATPVELSRLKSALDAIPNSGKDELNYEDWFAVIAGIDHATDHSDDGLELALEFSARSSKHNEEFFLSRVWPYLKSEREGAVVTENTIFTKAYGAGWVDPSLAEGFEVIEETPTEIAAKAIEKAQKGAAYQIYTAANFGSRAPLSWIVKGVLPKADVGMIFGPSGAAKSFLALDMAGAVARGIEWRGRKTMKGRVLYIAAEGAAGFRNRLLAYALENGIRLEDLDLCVMPSTPNFKDKKVVDKVIEAAKAAGPFLLIVADTLAQISAGADENDAGEMGAVMRNCQNLGRATGAMVVVIHHSGKDQTKGARGSSVIKAGLDVEIEIVRADKDRTATVSKLRDQEDNAEFGFRLKQVEVGRDEDGDAVTSCVLSYTESVARARAAREPRGANAQLAVQLVRDSMGLGGELPTTEQIARAMVPLMGGVADRNKLSNAKAVITKLVTERTLELVNGDQLRVSEGS